MERTRDLGVITRWWTERRLERLAEFDMEGTWYGRAVAEIREEDSASLGEQALAHADALYAAPLASAFAAAALVLLGVRVMQPSFLRPQLTTSDLVDEGVNDHLRRQCASDRDRGRRDPFHSSCFAPKVFRGRRMASSA